MATTISLLARDPTTPPSYLEALAGRALAGDLGLAIALRSNPAARALVDQPTPVEQLTLDPKGEITMTKDRLAQLVDTTNTWMREGERDYEAIVQRSQSDEQLAPSTIAQVLMACKDELGLRPTDVATVLHGAMKLRKESVVAALTAKDGLNASPEFVAGALYYGLGLDADDAVRLAGDRPLRFGNLPDQTIHLTSDQKTLAPVEPPSSTVVSGSEIAIRTIDGDGNEVSQVPPPAPMVST